MHSKQQLLMVTQRDFVMPENKRVQLIVPASLLDAFDKMIQERSEVLNRTSLLLQLMNGEIKKHERAKKAEEGKLQ